MDRHSDRLADLPLFTFLPAFSDLRLIILFAWLNATFFFSFVGITTYLIFHSHFAFVYETRPCLAAGLVEYYAPAQNWVKVWIAAVRHNHPSSSQF